MNAVWHHTSVTIISVINTNTIIIIQVDLFVCLLLFIDRRGNSSDVVVIYLNNSL